MHISNNDKKELSISGHIENVIFSNENNAFTVLRVKVKQYKKDIIVVGEMPPMSAGEDFEARGYWINNKDHGLQFQIISIKTTQPNSPSAIEKYLGSGLIKGIGPRFAKKLVGCFGIDILNIIESSPQRLREIDGVGVKRQDLITKGWGEKKIIREIMLFLYSYGVSPSRATKVYKKYGDKAIGIVSKNPYRLAKDISGIGFVSADKIALNLGFNKDSDFRINAAIDHCLLEAVSSGSCGMPKKDLIKNILKLLDFQESMKEKIVSQIDKQIEKEELTMDTINSCEIVFLKAFEVYEKKIAKAIIDLHNSPMQQWAPKKDKIDDLIESMQKSLQISLHHMQKEAIKLSLTSRFVVITGGPGTGKTTILKTIIETLKDKKIIIKLCAPTGRAAKRLQEATNHSAVTIHKMLEIEPETRKFKYNTENPIPCDLLIVDEASMIDVQIASAILTALSKKTSVIFVGDVDQLPSVGAGRFLQDIINSKIVPVAELTYIFRQQNNSYITTNAHLINKGIIPNLSKQDNEKSDFYFIEIEDQEKLVEKITQLIINRIPKAFKFDSKNDICVLSPMQIGVVGVRNLNNKIQAAFHANKNNPELTQYGQKFILSDKVMQTENNYDKNIFNGEIGIITNIDHEDGVVKIDFDSRIVEYSFDEMDQLVLAYAITVHKSQGSEYPVVIIPITMGHYTMLKRNLLYTAITRGKKLVIIIGVKKALIMGIKNTDIAKRYSQLEKFIKIEAKLLKKEKNDVIW